MVLQTNFTSQSSHAILPVCGANPCSHCIRFAYVCAFHVPGQFLPSQRPVIPAAEQASPQATTDLHVVLYVTPSATQKERGLWDVYAAVLRSVTGESERLRWAEAEEVEWKTTLIYTWIHKADNNTIWNDFKCKCVATVLCSMRSNPKWNFSALSLIDVLSPEVFSCLLYTVVCHIRQLNG